ncbi:hypothetical protein SLS58_000177 [Diplodia intermedia]|uniref:Uncharacterized protein n=1 Tax=Diplodia intermedia TaxID=856260 RepID=A0ABR3U510_9PEZI
MFTTNHTPSSSNSLYCDPQMVKKLLGTEDKTRRTAARQTHVPESKARGVDSGETTRKSQKAQTEATKSKGYVLRSTEEIEADPMN